MPSPLDRRFVLLIAVLVAGCTDSGQSPTPGDSPPQLSRLHEPDATQVATGRAAFESGALFQGVLPPDAVRHLYITWTEDLAELYSYYTDADAYRAAFDMRYGTHPSPFGDSIYPAGMGLAANGKVGIDCLLCHADRFRGETLIGLNNNRLDLRALVEDLKALPLAIETLKARNLPDPYGALLEAIPEVAIPEPFASLEVPTGAAGSNDGFGLGLVATAGQGAPADLETFMGYQQAAPWWTRAYKDRIYVDGAAPSSNIYTMMSTLTAFGLTTEQLIAYLPTFEAMRHYMCALEAPRWSDSTDLPPIDQRLAASGQTLFEAQCASCHGRYDGGAFPDVVVAAVDIGTDPLRTDQFTATEVDWFNTFIPTPNAKMSDNDGYIAPVLTGVWTTAPYLHNGSIPTLRALLEPSQRPAMWRRNGEDFDAVNVGTHFEVMNAAPDHDTVEGRKVVNTNLAGMGNGGHTMTSSLKPAEIDALLEYLKTL